MHEKKDHTEWEKDWLEGRISSNEAMERAGEVEGIVKLLKSAEMASRLEIPGNKTKDEAWAALSAKISSSSSTKVIPLYRKVWIGVAASVALTLGAFFLFKAVDQVKIRTSFAETKTIFLPDSSEVTINAASVLTYSKRNWRKSRELQLEGEAFFDVKKGSRFSVLTHLGDVQVLGTSFNVKTRNERLIVSCKTGRVKVFDADHSSDEVIIPGQSVTVDRGENLTTPQQIALDFVDTWREGHYYFESRPLREVFEELERQYDVQLNLMDADLERRFYTGYFNNANLEEALKLVCIPMGLRYTINENNTVTINDRTT